MIKIKPSAFKYIVNFFIIFLKKFAYAEKIKEKSTSKCHIKDLIVIAEQLLKGEGKKKKGLSITI